MEDKDKHALLVYVFMVPTVLIGILPTPSWMVIVQVITLAIQLYHTYMLFKD